MSAVFSPTPCVVLSFTAANNVMFFCLSLCVCVLCAYYSGN